MNPLKRLKLRLRKRRSQRRAAAIDQAKERAFRRIDEMEPSLVFGGYDARYVMKCIVEVAALYDSGKEDQLWRWRR